MSAQHKTLRLRGQFGEDNGSFALIQETVLADFASQKWQKWSKVKRPRSIREKN